MSLGRPRSLGANVHVADGSPLHFTDELTLLLRRRLRAGTLVLGIALFLTLLPTLSTPGLGLRLLVLTTIVSCHLVLRSRRLLSPGSLRTIELIMLGAFALQALYMPDVLILERARAGDFTTAVMDRYFNTGAWALFVVIYGLLIPNTWRRAAIVITALSCLPDLNFYLLGWFEPRVRQAFDSLHHAPPAPLMLIAAAVATYGAHTMYSIRREAFQAKQLGQYRLREKLGSGGMGEVYRAEHQLLKRPCAIKLIRPEGGADPAAIARFEREVQATARLAHPNTVEIYDYGRTDEGVFYYVMELLTGLNLQELVEQSGPLPPARALYLLRQVCAALHESHSLGLIHRDIKPANIFAARRGGVDDVAKLLDFGLVKTTASEDASITRQGLISGSPPYMSPEQAHGERIDARSDIYSLGATAYFLVTGGPPFPGKAPMEHLIAHARDPVVPPSVRNPAIPPDVDQIILRCLEKKPEARFPDVASLQEACRACACAQEWNADRAAQWWRELPQAAPTSKTSDPTRAVGPPRSGDSSNQPTIGW